MKYRTIGTDPTTQRQASVLSLGAMLFGTVTDEPTSMAILDRYVEAGGTFIDTSNNYAFWINSTQGGESEALLGRWRRSRGIGDEILIATKLGGRPVAPNLSFAETAKPSNIEGVSAKTIRESAERSRDTLGVDRIDLLYAHTDIYTGPLQESVEAFAELVADGTVGLLGASNHWSWRLERARNLAAAGGLPGYEILQYHHSYLRQRFDLPGRRSQDGNQGLVSGDLISYLREEPKLAMVAYSPLLRGAYVRPETPLGPEYDHAGTAARLGALQEVVKQTGATVNQVVLSWLMGGEVAMIPLVGASSVSQLDESLGAVELELTEDQRARLDATV